MTNVLQQQFLYCFTWSSNEVLNLNIFSLFFFLQTFLLMNSIFLFWPLNFLPSTNLFPSSWLIFVLFLTLWILVTVHKPCHVPYAWWITTWGTIFIEITFSASLECVRSWSHAFFITYDKMFTKKLLVVCLEKVTRRKKIKNKKTRMAIAKLFALNTNAIKTIVKLTCRWSMISFVWVYMREAVVWAWVEEVVVWTFLVPGLIFSPYSWCKYINIFAL